VTQLSRADSTGLRLRVAGVFFGLLILSACSSTEPSTPFGTYNLAACLYPDSIPRPVPCGYEQSDSLHFDRGTFTLNSDSTWASNLDERYFVNGTWEAGTVRLQGTYSPLPSTDRGLAYQIFFTGGYQGPMAAFVTRDTLSMGVLVYTRQ
jgi:hypothetical protein